MQTGTDLASNRRPRLLFLGHTLPWPPDGGPELRSLHLLRGLSKDFDVVALFFYRRVGHASAEALQERIDQLRQWAKVEAFPLPQELSRLRLMANHVVSVVTGGVYTRHMYASEPFRERLRELLAGESFDLIHVDSLDLSTYLPELPASRIVLGHHNVESELLRRRAATEPGALRRQYIRYQAALMEREEKAWCDRVALNLVVSERDAGLLRGLAPRARIQVVPNGVDCEVYQASLEGSAGIVFVGGYDWFANRDGMTFFCKDVLPLIEDSCPCDLGRASPGTCKGAIPDSLRCYTYRTRAGRAGLRPGCDVLYSPIAGRRWHEAEDPRSMGNGQSRCEHDVGLRGPRSA